MNTTERRIEKLQSELMNNPFAELLSKEMT
jgi:hypothetical protein